MRERRVLKYTLEITDEQELDLPMGAQLLHAAMQRGQLYLWALVDTSETAQKETRRLRIAGTGHLVLADNLASISTVIDTETSPGLILVWHVFEILKEALNATIG